MPVSISTPADERSTYIINLAFTDEDGNSITPSAATWTLSDKYGNVLNSRSAVVISPLSTSVDIVLTGSDLATIGPEESVAETVERRVLVEAVYDSDAGTDLYLRKEAAFFITNHAAPEAPPS